VSRDAQNLAILIVILMGLIFAAVVLSKTPREARDWKDHFARTAAFEETAPGQYQLSNLRTYVFDAKGGAAPGWSDASLDTDNLAEMWFFIEPFPENPLFAHSFLSFVFETEDGARKTVSVSIEARMEKTESYSAIAGVLRNYELAYVWSTEQDILTRIAVGLDHTLFAYKLNLDREQMGRLLAYFARRTNELKVRPRFYNTLHSNCTNELAKAVNEAFPKALPWHRSWVFTGRSADWLYRLGFIEDADAGSFDALTAASDIRELVQTHADAANFSDAWRGAFSTAAENQGAGEAR